MLLSSSSALSRRGGGVVCGRTHVPQHVVEYIDEMIVSSAYRRLKDMWGPYASAVAVFSGNCSTFAARVVARESGLDLAHILGACVEGGAKVEVLVDFLDANPKHEPHYGLLSQAIEKDHVELAEVLCTRGELRRVTVADKCFHAAHSLSERALVFYIARLVDVPDTFDKFVAPLVLRQRHDLARIVFDALFVKGDSSRCRPLFSTLACHMSIDGTFDAFFEEYARLLSRDDLGWLAGVIGMRMNCFSRRVLMFLFGTLECGALVAPEVRGAILALDTHTQKADIVKRALTF